MDARRCVLLISALITTRRRDSPFQTIMSCRSHNNAKNTDNSVFTETASTDARCLTDCVRLSPLSCNRPKQEKFDDESSSPPVMLPWMGFGTYRIGKDQAKAAVMQALAAGYRSIDTAFIYGGETTERLVGQAIKQALSRKIVSSRDKIFVTTKHWRKYHGYEQTLECLRLSLSRLQMEYVDLWLMHWPGPAWKTMNRRKELVERDRWYYAKTKPEQMVELRAETWRAMEDAYRKGLVRAIGVSNMSIEQLKKLKQSATLWPPAVNQVELHPLHPQTELLEYCKQEGIVVQAYASLGGQDAGKGVWSQLLGVKLSGKKEKLNLMMSEPVRSFSEKLGVTPAQLLLQYGLAMECALIPKTTSNERLVENAGALSEGHMTLEEACKLRDDLLRQARRANPEHDEAGIQMLTRLCWRSDPLRHLDFE